MKSKKFIYDIKKNKYEINLYYNIRKLFIETLKPTNNTKFKLYEMYSNILINKLFLKCSYNIKTEKIIKKFIENHKNILIS